MKTIWEEMIGKTFGKLKVISVYNGDQKFITQGQELVFECECECGEKIVRRGARIRRNKDAKCWKCVNKNGLKREQHSSVWKGIGPIGSRFLSQVKNAVEKDNRNLDRRKSLYYKEFNITLQDVYDIAVKQNFKCIFSGENLDFSDKRYSKTSNASIDRIDNSIGYVRNNIQLTTSKINILRGGLSIEAFIRMCKLIHNPLKENRKIELTCDPSKIFPQYKYYSNKINREFSISIKDLEDKLLEQNYMCNVTGIQLFAVKRREGNLSIDRINNEFGYTKDNIQLVTKEFNMFRGKMNLKELKELSQKIISYYLEQ